MESIRLWFLVYLVKGLLSYRRFTWNIGRPSTRYISWHHVRQIIILIFSFRFQGRSFTMIRSCLWDCFQIIACVSNGAFIMRQWKSEINNNVLEAELHTGKISKSVTITIQRKRKTARYDICDLNLTHRAGLLTAARVDQNRHRAICVLFFGPNGRWP